MLGYGYKDTQCQEIFLKIRLKNKYRPNSKCDFVEFYSIPLIHRPLTIAEKYRLLVCYDKWNWWQLKKLTCQLKSRISPEWIKISFYVIAKINLGFVGYETKKINRNRSIRLWMSFVPRTNIQTRQKHPSFCVYSKISKIYKKKFFLKRSVK